MNYLTTTLTMKRLKRELEKLPININEEVCIVHHGNNVHFIVTANTILAELLENLPSFNCYRKEAMDNTKIIPMFHSYGASHTGNVQLLRNK